MSIHASRPRAALALAKYFRRSARLLKRLWRSVAICAVVFAPDSSSSAIARDVLPHGARWTADVPPNWNGTLLLWSRGYSPVVGNPEDAPAQLKPLLLGAGYALAGSNYGSGGWALEEAVPAQQETVRAFAAEYGKPKRVIAWGNSMGGLVTTALAEARPRQIDGGAPFCSSMGGAVGMMNMALDGAFAFKTLIAPSSDIRLVSVDDDLLNSQRASAALVGAMETPQGRARIVLAGVLGGIPSWTVKDSPRPRDKDFDTQAKQIGDALIRGVFLPRVDQEKRAQGVFSWNTAVDYRRQLARSGRRPLVEAVYRIARLDLEGDLARLNSAPRIKADPSAVDYMMRNYTPSAKPAVPMLAVQAIGDGQTSPSLQQSYADQAKDDVRAQWLELAGHCNFAPGTVVTAIREIDARLQHGRWPARPGGFIAYRPPPMLRPCFRGRLCR